MKKILSLLFLCILPFTAVHAQKDVDCSKVDRIKITTWLHEAQSQKKSSNWLLYFGRKFIGTPYVGGTLDRADREKLVVDVSGVDCTTFVEQSLALALCARAGKFDFPTFCNRLARVRYIGGDIAYLNRNHYFTLWINSNVQAGTVRDIQGPVPPFSAIQKINVSYMSTHWHDYHMLTVHQDWIQGISRMEKGINGLTYRYIPKRLIGDTSLMRKAVKSGDILALVTNKKGLDISHVGIAVWNKNGTLHLLNASSIYHRVIVDPMSLAQYMSRHTSQIGIRVCRLR